MRVKSVNLHHKPLLMKFEATFYNGIFLGILTPGIGLFLYCIYLLQHQIVLDDIMLAIQKYPSLFGHILGAAIGLNLILIVIFILNQKEKLAQGILLCTMLYALTALFIIKFEPFL